MDEHDENEHVCREARMTEPSTTGPWGTWRLNTDTNELELYDSLDEDAWKRYAVDLDRADTPFRVLGWIYQCAGKHWAPKENTMYHLLDALQDLGYGTEVQGSIVFDSGATGQARHALRPVE